MDGCEVIVVITVVGLYLWSLKRTDRGTAVQEV